MGSVERTGSGKYRAIARDPLTGRKLDAATIEHVLGARVSLSCETETQALALLTRIERALDKPVSRRAPTGSSAVSLTAYIETMIEREDWSPKTIRWYRWLVAEIVDEMRDPTLQLLVEQPESIERWRTKLSRDGAMSARSANARVGCLKRMLTDAYKRGVIEVDPMESVKKVKGGAAPHRIVEADEFDAILRHSPHRLRAAWWLAYDAGLRREELAGLRLMRVNLLQRSVTVCDVMDPETGEIREWTKGTQPGDAPRSREVPLSKNAAFAIAEHVKTYGCRPNELLFKNDAGKAYTDLTLLTRIVTRIVRRAGLDDPMPSLHDLRHSFATRLARKGVPIADIAYLLGHKSIVTTQIYVDTGGGQQRRAWVRAAFDDDDAGDLDVARSVSL